jgi:outer membrane protein OmpA-like peptidoglycan-associated protein
MNRLATIAAAAIACCIGANPAMARDAWHGHRDGGARWSGPAYRYYSPRPYYAPRYWVTPGYAYGYYDPYGYYAPAPPPVIVERVYEAPPPIYYEAPPPIYQAPPVQRRYAEAAPPPPPPTSRPAAPVPRLERYTLSARELFAFDEATIRGSNAKLDEIADAMKANPQIGKVTITGYTDRIGTDAYNKKLSQRRAEAVKSYLVARGVEGRRLAAIGKGKANPVVQCNDKDRERLIRCLEPNRRVEVEQIVVETRAR